MPLTAIIIIGAAHGHVIAGRFQIITMRAGFCLSTPTAISLWEERLVQFAGKAVGRNRYGT
jgi:hypothetical protein